MDLNELRKYYQNQYDELEPTRILKKQDLAREEQKQTVDDELIFENNRLDKMQREYKKKLVLYMKLKEKYYEEYPLKSNKQNEIRMTEFKRQQQLIQDYDNTVKKIESANKETQSQWDEENKKVKEKYEKALKKWNDANKIVMDKIAKGKAQIKIDKEAAEEIGSYKVPERLTEKVRYVNLSLAYNPHEAVSSSSIASICASQIAVYATDDINKNIAAGKPVITQDTPPGGEKASIEVQRMDGRVDYKEKNRTFSFHSGTRSTEQGVSIRTRSGFKSLDDFVTAFKNHRNYSKLPYTIENVDNRLTLIFKKKESQTTRKLEKWGEHGTPFTVVNKGSAGPDFYPYKGQYKGYGTAQGVTNDELELKSGGQIHHVNYMWGMPNLVMVKNVKKKYDNVDEFAKSFYYASSHDVDGLPLHNPNTTRAFPHLETDGVRKALITKGKTSWPREYRWKTQFLEIDLGEPKEIYKVVFYGIGGRDKDDGHKRTHLFDTSIVRVVCLKHIL